MLTAAPELHQESISHGAGVQECARRKMAHQHDAHTKAGWTIVLSQPLSVIVAELQPGFYFVTAIWVMIGLVISTAGRARQLVQVADAAGRRIGMERIGRGVMNGGALQPTELARERSARDRPTGA